MKYNVDRMPGTAVFQRGFERLHDFENWRVMTSGVERQERPTVLQKHDLTDEVFIVLSGGGFMLLGDTPDRLEACAMEAGKSYVVPRGVWHSHVLAGGTQLLIVENNDTGEHNSPLATMTREQIEAYGALIEAGTACKE